MDWLLFAGFLMMWLPLILLVLGRAAGEPVDARDEVGSRKVASLDTVPFFATPRVEERSPASRKIEDQTVIRLQDYLRAEHEEAERFVSRPSVGSLYRNCGQGF